MRYRLAFSIFILAALAGCDVSRPQGDITKASESLIGCYSRDGFEAILITEGNVSYGDAETFQIVTYRKAAKNDILLLYVKPDKFLSRKEKGIYIFEDTYRPSSYTGERSSLFAEISPENEGESIDVVVDAGLERFYKVPGSNCREEKGVN